MVEFLRMTAAEYRDFVTKNLRTSGKMPVPEQKIPKQAKYHSEKTKTAGRVFDSKKEANRYCVLADLQNQGKIELLECQKVFLLQEGFRDNTGKWQRPITYICDFFYHDVETDEWVVEDVKSIVTRKLEVYRLKRKMFMLRYPEYKFREAV